MASLPRRRSTLSGSNPMTSDENLVKLLGDAKNFTSEEELNRWKESFLAQYKNYLNPAGVENAQASNGRLVRSLEKLAKTVVTVNEFVKEGKISKENQSVQGQRHLTNMTEQMASSEKEIARFMPTAGADEEEVGYDKFELGAVLIEDGFHVYKYLKTTKDIIEELQDIVLKDILSTNKLSIVQFYLRQIQTFCDVMADLGLFGLMETVLEIYKVKPRTKAKLVKESLPAKLEDIDYEGEEPLKPERVLDPNKKYKFRAAYTGGYIDPLSGTQPGRDEFEDPDQDTNDHPEGQGEDDDNHFVIFFDMKTGTIGKIPRMECKSNNLFFTENDKGEEQILGEVTDQAEKDQLIWDMKKAMKGNAPATPKQGPKRTSSGKSNALREIRPPPFEETSKKAPTRSRSGKSDGAERSMSLVEPSARKELMKTRSGGLLELRSSTLRDNEGSARVDKTSRRDHVMHSNNPTNVPSMHRRPGSVHESSTNVETKPNAVPVRRASTPLTAPSPSADGWAKPAAIAAKSNHAAPVRRSSTPLTAPSPSADGWAKPAAIAATRRTHKQQPVTNQAPSSTGWSNPSTLAARRRDGINSS